MNLKATMTKLIYRIQPKPEGGFVGIPADPAMERIEGATKEEVQEKIQAKITETIGSQLPASLKLGPLNITINHELNVTTRTEPHTPFAPTPQSDPMVTNLTSEPIVPSGGSGTAWLVIATVIAIAALLYAVLR
jgi:hypothetical protein